MTVEQKAKRYDEALKKVKDMLSYKEVRREDMEYIFPELKESEDKKIWKEIRNFIFNYPEYLIERDSWLAWLEKQGEQNPNPCDGCINRKGCINCENGELRETEQKPADKVDQHSLPVSNNSSLPTFDESIYHPCTEEVCEQKSEENKGNIGGISPNWSEEDEQYVKDTLALIGFGLSIHSIGQVQEWLQSLQDRVQPKQEWSEEDEKCLENAIMYCEWARDKAPDLYCYETSEKSINWLKSLRPQSQWKPSDEQMEYLSKAIMTLGDEGDCKTASILNELRTNLKKLQL